VKAWVTSDFHDVINVGLEGNRDFGNGRRMFGAANCYACHRFNEEGGVVGPDLTTVAGVQSTDLLESIVEPSRESPISMEPWSSSEGRHAGGRQDRQS